MLNAHLVDRLFAKLTIRYGCAFLEQWRDVDIATVKSDWASVLSGCDSSRGALDAIAWAINNLPDKPVNAITFRRLVPGAQGAGDPLPLPAPKVDPAVVERAMAAMNRPTVDTRTPAQGCVDGLLQRAEGGRLRPAQLHVLAHCLKVLHHADPRRERVAAVAGMTTVQETASST